MVLEFKAKQRPKSMGQFSKLQDPTCSTMQSTTSSAVSNGSTNSKCLHDLLMSDKMLNKAPWTMGGDAKSVELQLASYALESCIHRHYCTQ
ncbi:hypothetical protein BS47DRAFT_1352989 [Hydnum rufescens UP504]|uniref:Uncharacterized protein n=1 Tax=Hydnum rufescens UP504 TaxID=1448309 RepID=A0A9P6AI65_9AGAM|nr:hypothetical protein BS47DRAFT_1352989 [Hydnum rufescens UP504]